MKELGFVGKITELIDPSAYEGFEIARVIAEHKERYLVQSNAGTFNAEITGNLRFSASNRLDFPAVGDWVKIMMMDKSTAVIMEVFPRFSVLKRQSIAKSSEIQIIATNIDCAFVVQSVGHDFNLKRLERYLTICHSAEIEPVILLTKTDLVGQKELEKLAGEIKTRAKDVLVVPLSIEDEQSLDFLEEQLHPYKTYCFMGSSGVGKSTLINHLKGEEVLKTNPISASTNKGKHTTSHRELIVLKNKSRVIDTPGMRELGITDDAQGLEITYDEITELAENCRFSDCKHINETGCAVIEAVNKGLIPESEYDNYQKLKREQVHFSATIAEKRQKSKEQGKMIKSILAQKRKEKY